MASTTSPNFLSPVDVKLNASNYKEWCPTLGYKLLGHVDGTSPSPKEIESTSAS